MFLVLYAWQLFSYPFYIKPSCVAMSIAGVSGDNLTYAFFKPSPVIKVLTCSTLTLNAFSTASFICVLFDFLSTISINLFSISITLTDFSVARGYLMILYGSILFFYFNFPRLI